MPIAKLAASVRSAMAEAMIAEFDMGAGPATAQFYTGSMPASLGAVTTQTLLGTLTCSDPCATQSEGVITFSAITQDSAADAGGEASWVRILDGAGAAKADLDVTNNAGTGAVKLNTTTVVAGGPIQLSSLIITMPGA